RIKSVDQIIDEIGHTAKTNIVEDLNKLIKDNYVQMNKSHQDDPRYIITKHRKLYMMILTSLYILRHIDNAHSVIFDDYIASKLGDEYNQIQKSSRDIENDNQISNTLMASIDKNFPK